MIEKFVVVGLGNPKPYTETFHSAGHITIKALQALLPNQPHFTSLRLGRERTLASIGSKFVLLQSPTLMNVTGPWLAKAYKEVVGSEDQNKVGLVVLHDDLEGKLGEVRVRQWTASHKGHNGIKSINGSLRKDMCPTVKWARIAIGIGRPEERTPNIVSRYVLRPLQVSEMKAMDTDAPPKVIAMLDELEKRWTPQPKKPQQPKKSKGPGLSGVNPVVPSTGTGPVAAAA